LAANNLRQRPKTGQFWAKIEDLGTNSQENCGNWAFVVDFNRPEVAL
jgi:hypothetical protein